jgi:hypothetical protein
VVIDNFNIEGAIMAFRPFKTNPPPPIDSNTVRMERFARGEWMKEFQAF